MNEEATIKKAIYSHHEFRECTQNYLGGDVLIGQIEVTLNF